MAEELASDGTKVFTVGVGTANGGTIPVYDQNGQITGEKRRKRSCHHLQNECKYVTSFSKRRKWKLLCAGQY